LAKARKVKGIKCGESVCHNARKIIEVRLDEMLSWGAYVDDPERIEEIHNLRIAAKRLRYTLEMFSFAFPSGLNSLIKEVKEIQEGIGEMRDADVMVATVRDLLERQGAQHDARLLEIATASQRGTVAQRRARLRSAQSIEKSARDELSLYTLIAFKADESGANYARFRAAWYIMEETDFAGRLRHFVGIEQPEDDSDAAAESPNGSEKREIRSLLTEHVPEPVPDAGEAGPAE
jgi:hypothetical protein